MEILVNRALKLVGEVFPFSWSGMLDDIEFNGATVHFTDEASLNGVFSFDGKAFTVSGNFTGHYFARCARCDLPFTDVISFDFSERFIRSGVQNDEESYEYCGDSIDLLQAVTDNMLLNLPLVNVCSEDCKGLCPKCGVNLNKETCSCSMVNCNSPFSVLLQLQNEDKEV